MGDDTVSKDASESLEEMSGEWMRQQLQNAELAVPPKAPSGGPGDQRPGSDSRPAGSPSPPPSEPAERDNVLAELAQSVSQAVVGAVTNLEQHRVGQTRAMQDTLHRQDEQLRGLLASLAEVQGKLEEFSRFVEEQKSWAMATGERQNRFGAELETLRQIDTSREAALEDLRRETMELSISVSDRQDQTSGRLELQQADIDELKAGLADVSPKLSGALERLERQSRALRSVFEAERRREEAYGRLSEVASSLKDSVAPLPEGLSEELL